MSVYGGGLVDLPGIQWRGDHDEAAGTHPASSGIRARRRNSDSHWSRSI
jgi:hypothetical protein